MKRLLVIATAALLLFGCTTNNSKNVQDLNEDSMRESIKGDSYNLMRFSEISMVKAKNSVINQAESFCNSKNKIVLPNTISTGIETGWILKRQSYDLNFSCVNNARVNKKIKSVKEVVFPSKGKSGLYLIRPSGVMGLGSLLLYSIEIDGVKVGTLSTETFLYGQISPGKHTLRIKVHGKAKALSITTYVDKNLYVSVSPGWGNVSVDEIEEQAAGALLKSHSHSKDSMFVDLKKFK